MEAQGAVSILLKADMPHGPKPSQQWRTCILKNSSRQHRMHMMTFAALDFTLAEHPVKVMRLASWAYIAIWPTYFEQVLQAGRVICVTGRIN